MSKCFISLLVGCCYFSPILAQQATNVISALKENMANLHEDSPQKVDLLNELASKYRDLNPDSVYKYAGMAKKMAELVYYKKGEIRALSSLGFYYAVKANDFMAFKQFNDALDMAEKLQDTELKCLAMMDIAVLSAQRSIPMQAKMYAARALESSMHLEKDSVRSIVLLNYGSIHRDQLSLGQLNKYADTAEMIAKRYKDKVTLMQIGNYRGQVHFWKNGDPKESIKLFKASMKAYEGYHEYAAFNVQNYYGLGDAFAKIDLDSAVYYYEKGLELALQNEMEPLSMYGRSRVFDILREKEPHSDKLKAYSDDILKFQREHPLVDSVDSKNYLEVLLKEKDLKLEEEKNRARKIVFGIIGALALLTLGIAIYIWRLYSSKKVLSEELMLTNQELDEKKQFNEKVISILAHDLRQPFASILMVQELVKDGSFSLEDCKAVLYQMRLISEKSMQMLEGLLEWTKYNGLGLRLVAQKVNLKESIESGIRFNNYDIEDKGLKVEVAVDEDMNVYAQSEMLLFLNRNIISNAVKYTGQGGEIKITAQQVDNGKEIAVCIRDSGMGISPDVLGRLFSDDNTTSFSTRTVKGAGIAMIICHDMVRKMEGKIWAENNVDGPGASFYYQLRFWKPVEERGVFYLEDRIGA